MATVHDSCVTSQITSKILIRKVKRQLSSNIKQCDVYENHFVNVPTNCVRNIVGKSTVTQYLDKKTRDL